MLGAVNRAEHMALESLEVDGERPFVLRLLARISLAKGDLPTARVFLNMLRRDLLHGAWAESQLARLKRDPTDVDEKTRHVRRVMLTNENLLPVANTDWLGRMLDELLDHNSRNRMALEYLMAHYLLTGQLDKLVANVGRMKAQGCETIPRHVGEGILVFQQHTRRQVDLRGMALAPATLEAYSTFGRLQRSFGPNQVGLTSALARELPGSYFYYFQDMIYFQRMGANR